MNTLRIAKIISHTAPAIKPGRGNFLVGTGSGTVQLFESEQDRMQVPLDKV